MKRIIIFLMFLILSAPAFAVDWQAKQITREKTLDKEDKVAAFKDAAGSLFYIENGDDINDEEAASILSLKDIFNSWQSIKIKEIRYLPENGVVNVMISSESVQCNSIDIAPYLTAGMNFVFENQSLSYNFRIKKENYFLRINGAYISEKVLCDKMLEAIQTPKTFVQRRDPDYLLSHIERMDAEIDLLKKTTIALSNHGLFSNDGPVDSKTIDRVVSIKRGNLKISKKEIVDTLSKETIKISDKALELILNVYFDEFEK